MSPRFYDGRDDLIPDSCDRSKCPTPHKEAYGSRSAAKKVRKRFSHARNNKLSAYLCPCGGWHLGRLPESVKQGHVNRRPPRPA